MGNFQTRAINKLFGAQVSHVSRAKTTAELMRSLLSQSAILQKKISVDFVN